MQDRKKPNRKAEQSERTRGRLIEAARQAFAACGYANSSTPAIADAAGVTRGALYHQFADKTALFGAVVEELQGEVVDRIEGAADASAGPFDALVDGSLAFLDACARPDVLRIVLTDAPAVLGWSKWREIDRRHGMGSLRAGLKAAVDAGALRDLPVEAMTYLLSGALNEAALAIAESEDPPAMAEHTRVSVVALLKGLQSKRDL